MYLIRARLFVITMLDIMEMKKKAATREPDKVRRQTGRMTVRKSKGNVLTVLETIIRIASLLVFVSFNPSGYVWPNSRLKFS